MRKILEATSVHDLEKIGNLDFLLSELEEAVAPLKVNANSYADFLALLEILKEKWLPFSEQVFTSERQQVIYYLIEHDGKKRNDLLGITDEMYENPDAAKKWFRRLVKIIRPDINTDSRSAQAFQALHDIRSNLVDDEAFGENDD